MHDIKIVPNHTPKCITENAYIETIHNIIVLTELSDISCVCTALDQIGCDLWPRLQAPQHPLPLPSHSCWLEQPTTTALLTHTHTTHYS